MKRYLFILSGALALALAHQATAQEAGDQTPLASNFIYNYYTVPGASQVTAGMYPAPYWAPPHVGHTYYTYQPLMPHEHMYEHRRNYYQYYGGPESFYQNPCPGHTFPGGYGLNKTTVVWQNGASHVGPNPLHWASAQGIGYHIASRKYCLGDGTAGGCFGGHCLGGHCAGGHCRGGHCAGGDCAGGAACATGQCQ
jgi:hypothetical protein